MANIYEEKQEHLHALLDRARTDDGATVVIPELQRPYVWTPNQVTLLVDSLIRGWPFGTLLMWKVNHEELDGIPHRPFWRTIDRTAGNAGTTTMRKNPPATYHMVLDGQQRVQSLLLALGGDDWGFTLEDRDWIEELQDRRPRGRQPKYRHWSKASLCFDLDLFLQEYKSSGGLLSIDFRSVLTWAITDSTGGQSKFPKPDNYSEPLPKAFNSPHDKRLLRLSRLWNESQPNPNLKEKDFRQIGETLLRAHNLSDEKISALLEPLGEFMTTLRDVKRGKVTYLELVPFDSVLWTREAYNDAIVNIFTRLNTAGRTLTREEITFAWLKSNWNAAQTGGRTAAECFDELRDELKSRELEIGMDELVNAISFFWSASFNDGKLLANSDLLKGSIIRPMAVDLSGTWSIIRESMIEVIDVVDEHGFAFGPAGQYASVNALAVLWAWYAVARGWCASHALSTIQKDDFDKKCRATFNAVVDRWLLCSTWAGQWSGSSNTAVAGYAKELSDSLRKIQTIDDHSSAHRILTLQLESFVKALETDAATYVNNLSAPSRERVSIYRNVLWLWHRLDADRWASSRIALRTGKTKKTTLEVDHTLSYAYWERRLQNGFPTGYSEMEESLSLANLLGNCSLLEKTFNISKSDKTLKSFMEQVHEFKERRLDLDAWALSLSIPLCLLDPSQATSDEIAAALKTRDEVIRAEVVDFVRGSKTRKDL
ncbi:MAG TPA: DUF262 domain-containing protein [Pirellulales bacterium]|nr:DUF262 domain-containing protein [Pirellulales bacterium]